MHIIYLRKIAVIIQNVQNTRWFCCNEVNCRLVVLELNVLPANLLFCVLLLLQLKDVLVEKVLQGLVSKIYTQLFKTVQMKVLQRSRLLYKCVECIFYSQPQLLRSYYIATFLLFENMLQFKTNTCIYRFSVEENSYILNYIFS